MIFGQYSLKKRFFFLESSGGSGAIGRGKLRNSDQFFQLFEKFLFPCCLVESYTNLIVLRREIEWDYRFGYSLSRSAAENPIFTNPLWELIFGKILRLYFVLSGSMSSEWLNLRNARLKLWFWPNGRLFDLKIFDQIIITNRVDH